MRLTFTWNLDEFRVRTKGTFRVLEMFNARAVRQGLKEGAEYARNNHLHTVRTGLLTSPTMLRGTLERADEREAWGYLRNDTPYAGYVEGGTKAHEIWPKEGHGLIGPLRPGQSRRAVTDIGTHRIALRFWKGGRLVFARMVRHPGTPPLPFMGPASEYAAEVIARETEHVTFPALVDLWD